MTFFLQVYSGVGFSAHDSYVKLIPRNEFNTIEKVEIVFSSYDDSGILMMGLRQFTSVNIHLSEWTPADVVFLGLKNTFVIGKLKYDNLQYRHQLPLADHLLNFSYSLNNVLMIKRKNAKNNVYVHVIAICLQRRMKR